MPAELEAEFGRVLAALGAAEVTLRDVERHLERLSRCVENLHYYVRTVEGLPSPVEWDVVRETLADAVKGEFGA